MLLVTSVKANSAIAAATKEGQRTQIIDLMAIYPKVEKT